MQAADIIFLMNLIRSFPFFAPLKMAWYSSFVVTKTCLLKIIFDYIDSKAFECPSNFKDEFGEKKRKTAINKLHYSMLDYVQRKRISFPVNWMSVKFFFFAFLQTPISFQAELFHGFGIVQITVVLILLQQIFLKRKMCFDKLSKYSLASLHLTSIWDFQGVEQNTSLLEN